MDFQIQTRHNCCNDRYKEMCLFADDKKIACTSQNFKIGKAEWFNFTALRGEVTYFYFKIIQNLFNLFLNM
jgi:hypothetical protein